MEARRAAWVSGEISSRCVSLAPDESLPTCSDKPYFRQKAGNDFIGRFWTGTACGEPNCLFLLEPYAPTSRREYRYSARPQVAASRLTTHFYRRLDLA